VYGINKGTFTFVKDMWFVHVIHTRSHFYACY